MSEAEPCSGKVAGDPNTFARHNCSRMAAQRSRAASGERVGQEASICANGKPFSHVRAMGERAASGMVQRVQC